MTQTPSTYPDGSPKTAERIAYETEVHARRSAAAKKAAATRKAKTAGPSLDDTIRASLAALTPRRSAPDPDLTGTARRL